MRNRWRMHGKSAEGKQRHLKKREVCFFYAFLCDTIDRHPCLCITEEKQRLFSEISHLRLQIQDCLDDVSRLQDENRRLDVDKGSHSPPPPPLSRYVSACSHTFFALLLGELRSEITNLKTQVDVEKGRIILNMPLSVLTFPCCALSQNPPNTTCQC